MIVFIITIGNVVINDISLIIVDHIFIIIIIFDINSTIAREYYEL